MADGNLRDIVNITITRATTAVSRKAFGTALVLGEHNKFTERIRFYSSITALVSDGFDAATDIYKAVAAALGQNPAPVRVAVGRKAATESWAAALTAVKDENNEWYGLAITSRDRDDILEASAWIETDRKLFSAATFDPSVLDAAVTNDLASELKGLGRDRTFISFAQAGQFPDAAWLGKMLVEPQDDEQLSGVSTWKFKQLSGVSPVDFSETQTLAAIAKAVNFSQIVGGVKITREGVVTSGEFIDVIFGIDWFHARLTEKIYFLLVNTPKVPYTDAGLTALEGKIRKQWSDAVAVGFANGDVPLQVVIPRVADIDPNLKARRAVEGITFCFTLAGAVHSVTIQGKVTL